MIPLGLATIENGFPQSGHKSGPASCFVSGERGFTLFEVIAVLVLMGIVAAVSLNRTGDTMAQADVSGAIEVVKSHLRFAQTKAMNSDLPWGIQFNGSTYTLQNTNTPADTAPLPGDLPQGMTFATTVNPVMFENRWGSPVDNSNTPVVSDITVTVSKGGVSQTITVTKNTGFIP